MRGAAFTNLCQRLLPGATVVVAATLALRRLDDFDTWWHLSAGRWIVSHGTVPWTDTLSSTVPDHPWINLQWLYDVLLYLVYRLGGADGLVIASALAFAAATWLLTKNLRLFVGPVPTAILTLWALLIAEERFLIRPEMVSFVLLELLLWLLLTVRRTDGRYAWWLVPLMLIWVNCHALFIIGVFCIGSAAVAPVLARLPLLPVGWREGSALSPTATRRLLIAAAAAVSVTLVNPYGIHGVLFPLKLLSRIDGSSAAFQSIGEFARPFSSNFRTLSIAAYQAFFISSVLVVTLATLVSLRRSRAQPRHGAAADPTVDLGRLAMFIGLAYVSLLARRNIGLFVLGAAPVMAEGASILSTRVRPAAWRVAQTLTRVAAAPVLVTCAAAVLAVASNGYYRWDGTTREFGLGVLDVNFPIRAVDFVRALRLPGKLYNDLTAGGYLTWDPPVAGGTFIDGRLEVYDATFFAAYNVALRNPRIWEREAAARGINTVLLFHRWPNRQGLIQWLHQSRRWSLVYYDEVAVVFVRTQGNEKVIEEARRRFPKQREATGRRLARTGPRWQWPVGRQVALESYATLLVTLDLPGRSIEFWRRLVALGIPPEREAQVRYGIAWYLAQKGERDQARAELKIASARDPANAAVRQLLARLGG